MGEWNERGASPEVIKFWNDVQEAERASYAAWRRGDPPPQGAQFEARAPKHVYQGNRKQRRTQARGNTE